MSSEIFYAKAFLRVGDRFIPVVNHGSSNCYDFDTANVKTIMAAITITSCVVNLFFSVVVFIKNSFQKIGL